MYNADGTTIRMTRGDTAIFQIGMTRNGETYTPEAGDAVRGGVFQLPWQQHQLDLQRRAPVFTANDQFEQQRHELSQILGDKIRVPSVLQQLQPVLEGGEDV